MSSINHIERDCTDRCKSKEHGDIICSVLTKRAVSDEDLCAYLNSLCCRCESVKDHVGRTALHIASSCGRLNVVRWLLHTKQANINIRDDESGYTALHRSIFYGKIDVATYLIQQGASFTTTDSSGLTPLEHALVDSKLTSHLHKQDKSEVYVWGLNTNYVLGPQHARFVPELLDSFHKEHPHIYIKQVCLEKFHCVLVTNNGQVYSCGHGYGGRLGHSTEEICMSPKLIKFTPRFKSDNGPVCCIAASINIDHSVFLSDSGHVWTCGLNTHFVLGIKPPPEQMLEPYQLKYCKTPIRGVAAGRYHTVAWGSENIFTWGFNGGQLGHDDTAGKYIVAPKMVSCLFKPRAITVSNCATAVLNTHGNICIFYGYEKIKVSAKLFSLKSISLSGGRFFTKLDNSITEENNDLKLFGLNEYGNMFIWQEAAPTFLKCVYFLNRSLNIFHMTSNINEILFVTHEGEAFRGTLKYAKMKSEENFHVQKKKSFDILESTNYQVVKVVKVPNVHRAVSIVTDSEGKNFAVLQVSPSALLSIPEVSPSIMIDDMLKLFHTLDNESYQIVAFKISDRLFNVHPYFIAIGCSKLYKVVKDNPNQVIEFPNGDPKGFEQLILFLYMQGYKSSDIDKLLQSANILIQSGHEGKESEEQPKGLFKANKCDEKFSKMENYHQCQRFSHTYFPELHDIILRSKDDKLISVHGCILTARSEYFRNFFSMRWQENLLANQEINLQFPYSTLIMLIEYLYTDELPLLSESDLDQVCNLLSAADYMCIIRLKEICECTLCDFVTLKNIGLILSFAANYHAHILKDYCMNFITLNLAAILELKALSYIDHRLLQELTDFYSNCNSIKYRILTPYMAAPSDEEVKLAGKLYPVVFEDSENESKNKSPPKSQKRRSRQRKSSSSESNLTKRSDLNTESEISLSPSNMTIFQENVADIVPPRIKAIVSAHEIIGSDRVTEMFTKLNTSLDEISFEDFPVLSNNSEAIRQPKCPKSVGKHKITKVSQKERKRLSSVTESSVPNSPVSESPKNPWKIIPQVNSPDQPVAVQSIIVEEKRQKENFIKMKFKHLVHIQIEDKAIEDLYKFYNADNVFEEIITIGRVQVGAIATPQWNHTNKKN